ncbi:MAG: dynamin family protein [Peptostreptococcaceae bacterium]
MNLKRDEELKKMSNLLDKIVGELNSIKQDLEAYKSNYSELVNLIEDEVKKNRVSINELKNPFLLFIIGSGNYGKSTLINCLIKDDFIKISNLPNTWKLDLFIKDNKEKIDFTYEDNTKGSKDLKEGLKLLKLEENKYKDSKKKISKLVNDYKNTQEFDVSEIQNYKFELDQKYLYKSNITEIKYYINKGGLLQDFIIVDTPGLNQTLSKNTYERMMKYYERADGIIWMIDAQNLISKESYNLIDQINKFENKYKHKKDIIGVVNKMDIIKISNEDNVKKVKIKAKELYDNKFNDLVFISAKMALNGIVKNDKKEYDKSNINELLESIKLNFFIKSEEKQIKSKYKNLYIMKEKILKEITIYKREVYKDISKYNESKFTQSEYIREFRAFVNEYLTNITLKYSIDKQKTSYLLEEIEKFQQICSVELNKIYNEIIYKSNLNKIDISKKLNIYMNFTKSKYLVQTIYIYNREQNVKKDIFKDILNTIVNNKVHEKNTINEQMRFNLKDNVISLSKEINDIIEDNIELIEKEIDQIRVNSFKLKNIEYEKVRTHIKYLNNIEKHLTSLG